MLWLISFSKFSDVLPAFTFASAIDNLESNCLRLTILRSLEHFALYLASDSKKWLRMTFLFLFHQDLI